MSAADEYWPSAPAGSETISEASAGDATRSLRWSVYTLLIVAAAAAISGRILSVTAAGRDPKTPFLSANDRSRWAMIRALADHGTFVIDDVIFDPETGKRRSGWHTIDLVRHRGWDGREHYYSSKPVLVPTLMAGVYWLVKQTTGAGLATQPFYAGRVVLWLCNVPPLVLMWWLLARLIERYGSSDWSRLFTMTAATFGTLLSTFSITLNNHLHAAVCVTATVFFLDKVLRLRKSQGSLPACPPARLLPCSSAPPLPCSPAPFLLAGLFAALTFANELPALAFLTLVALAALWADWRKTLLYFVPASAIVLIAMIGLNYAAHGSLRPPYTHRSDGPVIAALEADVDQVRSGRTEEIRLALGDLGLTVSENGIIKQRTQVNKGDDVTNRFLLWDEATQQRFALELIPDKGLVEIRKWDNWYDYEGTYWTAENKRGVDRGEPSQLVYAFHCLVGHHGLFSLTPLWLIAFAGMFLSLRRFPFPLSPFPMIAAGTLLLSTVCLGFYLFLRPLEDRNYGGVCNGLRWMMWFIPLYLLMLLPVLERLSRSRWGRALALACLAVSVFSASYKPMNPWSHPWLFDYWEYLGLIAY